jgi:hypothetical protein
MPIGAFRDDEMRSAIIAAVNDAPCDAIWLKIENFGDDATGEKTVAYIKACRDFHARGVPLIADHVGGLPGLATLAFSAVGGIAHGVTMNQSFKASRWRLPPKKSNGGATPRVYLSQLDMLVKPEVARAFINSSQRLRGKHVCKDTHCCGRGVTDMLDRPTRHALYQRAREIEGLSNLPQGVRVSTYLDNVRRVSDEVARAAAFDKIDPDFRRALQQKQRKLGNFRDGMAHVATTATVSLAMPPLRRSASGRK